LSPDETQWTAQLAQAHALAGNVSRARSLLAQLEGRAQTQYVSPYHLAFAYTGLGDHEHAIELLERALEQRGGAIYGVNGSFLFASLREHPRFKTLLARMNLD
jgi:tetratricopeptide (TPR) repeat protein